MTQQPPLPGLSPAPDAPPAWAFTEGAIVSFRLTAAEVRQVQARATARGVSWRQAVVDCLRRGMGPDQAPRPSDGPLDATTGIPERPAGNAAPPTG